ncbi:MAG TPA: immunity 8 family protein [Puia sp.]|jgi:hypothetical protein
MVSEVKSMISPDILDFNAYFPDDCKSFSFLIQVMVGPKGENSSESFAMEVCTPNWLNDHREEYESVIGKGKLIVFKFDLPNILSRIEKIFDGCTGKDWNEIAINLSRYGHWEFENYQERMP